MRHLLTLLDLGTAELIAVLTESARLKADFLAGKRPPLLAARFRSPVRRTECSYRTPRR